MKPWNRSFRATALVAVIAASLASAPRSPYSKREKAFYADQATVEFVRPGLTIVVNSASIASGGTIAVVYTISDPNGLPLDAAGVSTPGAVALSFIAATIPKGQEQYVAYTTKQAAGAVLGTVTQPGKDSGGVISQIGNGQYKYTFKTHAPSGYDATATHTIGIYGSRDLTQFNLGTDYGSQTFNFVPNGAAVTVTRDVIRTASCNNCHDQLSHHGGSRRGIEMCVLCHTPQNSDPNTGNSLDLKVLAHKIHMGSQLPSVVAGKPYQIGAPGDVSDFSAVVDPADPRRCAVCHQQTTGAAQAKAYLTEPTRAACGACHDDVNFATGVNHPAGPEFDDNQCATCHVPQGEIPFDASIIGAHTVPEDSPLSPAIVAAIVSVTNGVAGKAPTVTFTVKDGSGNPIPISTFDNGGALRFTMAGPTTDYGYTSFGSDVKTPGYVTESPSASTTTCGSDGTCTYKFTHAVPASATGSYAIGMEAELTATLLAGTTSAQTFQYHPINQVTYFSVDGSQVQPRRTVASIDNCNQCHFKLETHGGLRNQIEMCVLCHNPSQTDVSQRVNAQDASQKKLPPQSVDFSLMVHRIHDGVNMLADGGSYTVIGFGGSTNDFSQTLFPALSPQGDPTDLRNCAMCHVNSSEENLPVGLNNVLNPQGWINPEGATATACSGCHVAKDAAAHFAAMTDSLGESCTICHTTGQAFDVDQVHAQY